jgi:hypothetical protein
LVRAFSFMTMLKFTFIYIASILSAAFSQDAQFPIDETGNFIFTEVVEIPGINKEALYSNGEAFMKQIKVLNSKKRNLQKNDDDFIISNKGSFYVYRVGSVKKAIDGAVEYDITLEVKDGKYRYTITNFLYNEYKKNRYGKSEPIKGKYMPLEMEVSSLNSKQWEKHREVVYEKTQDLILNLNGEMIYSETKDSKKVKKQDNW